MLRMRLPGSDRLEAGIDVTLLAFANTINSRLRVHCPRTNGGSMNAVVDPTARRLTKHTECMPMSFEQHPLTDSAFPQEMSREGHAFAAGKRALGTRGCVTV